jgi:hypothetical protein
MIFDAYHLKILSFDASQCRPPLRTQRCARRIFIFFIAWPWPKTRGDLTRNFDLGGCTGPGKNTKNDGKSPCFMGKSPISMAIFNSKVLVFQLEMT